MRGTVTRSELRHAIATLCPGLVSEFDAADTYQRIAELISLALQQYRRLAKTHHPDQGGNADTFIRLTQARDVVSAACTSTLPSMLLPERRSRMKLRIRINGVEIPISFD